MGVAFLAGHVVFREVGQLVAHDDGQAVLIALDHFLQHAFRDHDRRPHLAGLLIDLGPEAFRGRGIGVDLFLRVRLDEMTWRPVILAGVFPGDQLAVQESVHHLVEELFVRIVNRRRWPRGLRSWLGDAVLASHPRRQKDQAGQDRSPVPPRAHCRIPFE